MRRLITCLIFTFAVTTAANASPTDDVRQAMINLSQAHSFHMSMQINGMAIETDEVPPDRFHVTSSMFEMIMLPNAMYMKMHGTWTKVPGQTGMNSVDQTAALRSEMKSGSFTATDLGMKLVGGQMLHAYSVVSASSKKASTLYVNAQHLPARMEFGDAKGAGAATFSNFNAPVTINAPI